MRSDRRSFLKMASGAAGFSLLPPNLRAVLGNPAAACSGTIKDVEHVVIFMQENRSFDHYFGMLRGVRGFSDPRAINLPNGKPVWFQPKDGDVFTPFHLDTHQTSAQCAKSLDHTWKGAYDRWKDHDFWVKTRTKMTMGYFQRHDIPFYHALADAFTICDAYHCSVFGPTTPNRLHLWSGTSGLTVDHDGWAVSNPDENNETADIRHDSPEFHAFKWTTYAEKLHEAGIDWRVYQEYDNYGDNGLAYFRNFRDPDKHRALLQRGRSWVKGSNRRNAKASRGEHLVAAFAADVAMDRLPQVSWIVAPYIMCEHPTACPSYGEALVAQLLDALAANRDVWAKTAFILNYDENDGLFDHMPPPVPAISPEMGASTVDIAGEIYKGIPFGLGPRVPMLVVSPWTAGGFVNSQVFDHTSILRFLEARFGVAAPNISPWRRAVTGDLTSVFDFSQLGMLGHFADGTNGMRRADRQCELPPAQWQSEDLPRQEPGQRPARALPYDFEVTGHLVPNGFVLGLINEGRAGASFRAATAGAGPWFFTIEAGKRLSYTLPRTDAYDFTIAGPNGFLRRFAGSSANDVQASFMSGTLRVQNDSSAPVTLRNGYDRNWNRQVGPGQTIVLTLDLAATANWYDVTVDGPGGFARQFAGHIENGMPSLSDPLLG